MTTLTELMRVLQFGDSLLPVGAFTFSNGLESAVQCGIVHDAESLRGFVRTAVEQAASSDGIALLHAFRASRAGNPEGIDRADHASYNRKLNEEMRTMAVRMGRKLAELADRLIGTSPVSDWLVRIRSGTTPGCFPIGQALVFEALGLSEQDAFAVHQYGLASMMTAAALRLMKLHYLDAQAILFEVNAEAARAYERLEGASLDEMAAFAPVFDIGAAAHLKTTIRMFMN